MSATYPDPAAGCTKLATVNAREFPAVRRAKTLFDVAELPAPGSMNDGPLVRSALIAAIKKCGKSRAQLCEDISRLTGRKLTEIALNKFTAESRQDYRFPAELDRAFCAATGDDTLLICRVELAGYSVITAEEKELLSLGREHLRQKRASEKIALIEAGLRGAEEL